MKKTRLAWTLAACFGAGAAHAQSDDRATVLVLDASGSMWGQVDGGRTKVEVAREVLAGFLGSRDAAAPLGVIAYGHRRRGDCGDIEVVAPVARQPADALAARLGALVPRGKTPLGASLRLAARQLPRTAEQADIVLVTDGLETCQVDPCAVADELAAAGVRIRAHVVGFGLSEQEAGALACIAERTGGQLLRPQSGAELSEALSRVTADAPPAAATGTRLVFSYPGAMPDRYEWRLRDERSGRERTLATVEGGARYQPYPLDLAPGDYTALVSARAGRGETRFTVGAKAQDVVVVMQGLLPVTTLVDRGPYAARGEAVAIDLGITQAGQEAGGAALALRLYPAGGGEAITYSTVDGGTGPKQAAITLPADAGRYRLQLETWGGDVLQTLDIRTETDPTVQLAAPPVVAPGATLPVTSRGGQRWNDRIEIWQGESRVEWGLSLGDLASGHALRAPARPGRYTLRYVATGLDGDDVAKARVDFEVGAVRDDATGPQAQAAAGTPAPVATTAAPARDDGQGHGPDDGADGRAWTDYPHACLGNDNCEMKDAATGLSFFLPKGWVADEASDAPWSAGAAAAGDKAPVHMSFHQAGGNLQSMELNPRQWLAANGPCVTTRAGQLCLWKDDAAPHDPAVAKAMGLLQHTLTTGRVIRRCGDAPCDFAHPNPAIGGRLPARWSVEAARVLPDGRLSTWFFDRDRAGNVKLLGLNQPGGEACVDVTPGNRLCEFTPYIDTTEVALIRDGLAAVGLSGGDLRVRSGKADGEGARRLDSLLEGR